MDYFVDNHAFGSIRDADGNPVFPERLWKLDDIPCVFHLEAGPDEFAWNGVPGERYHVTAPLHAVAWGEEYRSRFGQWRCAVFAPKELDPHKIPAVVFAFTGIGADYSDCGYYAQPVVNRLGCILVTFDTHGTGIRFLGDDPTKDHFEQTIHKMRKDGCPMRDDAFAGMVTEIAFNVQQVRAFLRQRHGIPEDCPCLPIGFSLGGFYASQIAGLSPNCLGCVAGAAAPDIMQYRGQYQLARKIPTIILDLATHFGSSLASMALAIKDVSRSPYPPGSRVPLSGPFRQQIFVVGTGDPIVGLDDVRIGCAKLNSSNREIFRTIAIPGGWHDPGNVNQAGSLGHTMMDEVQQLIDWHRRWGDFA